MTPTVLLIEDNEQNLYLTTFLLERHGVRVVQARSGPEGLALARMERHDLIIMDIQLPGMDGYAVTKELRQDPSQRGVPIVAVTSFAMPGDRERAIEAGCSGYIEKPINPDTFLNEIRRFLAF